MHFDVLRLQAQHLGGGHGVQAGHLGAHPQFSLVTIELHGAVQRLHGRVGQVRKGELGADLLRRVGQRGHIGGDGDGAGLLGQGAVLGEQLGGVGLFHAGGVPFHLECIAPLLGGPVAFGNDGHAFAAAVGGHAQHGFHALDGLGGAVVQRLHLGAKHRWAGYHGGEHAGQAHVNAVVLLAAGFGLGIKPAGGLADDAELFRVFEGDLLGHGLLHGGLGQRAVAQFFAAGAHHKACVGAQGGCVHPPLRGSGRHQHGAGAGTQLAVLGVRVFQRVGAAREVHAKGGVGIGGVGVAVHAAHFGPVGVQLFGQDHGQAGLHALAKVQAVDGDGDGAIGVNAHKGRGLLEGLEPGGRSCVPGPLGGSHQRVGPQRKAGCSRGLEEGAACHAFGGGGICFGIDSALRLIHERYQAFWHVGAGGVSVEMHGVLLLVSVFDDVLGGAAFLSPFALSLSKGLESGVPWLRQAQPERLGAAVAVLRA